MSRRRDLLFANYTIKKVTKGLDELSGSTRISLGPHHTHTHTYHVNNLTSIVWNKRSFRLWRELSGILGEWNNDTTKETAMTAWFCGINAFAGPPKMKVICVCVPLVRYILEPHFCAFATIKRDIWYLTAVCSSRRPIEIDSPWIIDRLLARADR